jgi:hypothetical protein
MIKNTLPILDEMGVAHAWVYTSIATRMKCGIGNAVAAKSVPSTSAKNVPCSPWSKCRDCQQITEVLWLFSLQHTWHFSIPTHRFT